MTVTVTFDPRVVYAAFSIFVMLMYAGAVWASATRANALSYLIAGLFWPLVFIQLWVSIIRNWRVQRWQKELTGKKGVLSPKDVLH